MSLFEFNIPEWIFVALSLLILIFFLQKFLWKPVGDILEKRQANVIKAQRDAEAVKADMLALESVHTEMENDLEKMSVEKMKDARVRAGREYDRIIAEAESKAHAIVNSAHAQAERERENMLVTAREDIITASLAIAGTLLETTMDSEQNRRLVHELLLRKSVRL